MELSNTLIVSIGVGTVFVGLICLVFICALMSSVCKLFVKDNPGKNAAAPSPSVSNNAPIANKQEIVAACCAVIAEEIGTEADNIKVVSFKRA